MQVVIPQIAQNIQTAEILALLVRVGQIVLAEQPVLELEAGRASFELRCPASGKIEQILVGVGDDVQVGDVVLMIRTSTIGATTGTTVGTSPAEPAAADDRLDDLVRTRARTAYLRAGPTARRRARELQIDLQALASEHHGRVTVDQVEARAGTTNRSAQESGPMLASVDPPASATPARAHCSGAPLVGAPLTAAPLAGAPLAAPPLAVHELLDITGLDAARRRYRDLHERGPRPSAIVFVVKACAVALREHPRMNSSLLPHGRALAIKRQINIAVSLDTAHGRATPVIRDADHRPLADLAAELDRCAVFGRPVAPDTRVSRLSPDSAEPTFSISNLRSFGGVRPTPRVHAPQVAALGLCRTYLKRGRTMLPVSLGYHPRVHDAAAAHAFMNTVAELLTDPIALLMRV
jgi:pyruvate dehydrogenase E2 component (dihydrolipoamide acetyltransferase)